VVVTTNTTAPIGVSAGSNQTLTCASTSVALNGSVTTPTNVLLDWGTSVCGTQTTAVTAACVAGVYTLTATDPANGCVATSSVEVFPNAGAPTATISSTALVIDCNNASQSVTVTSTPNTNVTYTWNIAPATLSTDGSIVSFTSPNTYICTVTNTLSNCSTPVQVVVTTNTTVPTAVTTDTTIPCGASSIILDAVSSATNVSYNWTTSGAGIISTPTASSTSVNSAGQYEVTVTDNTNGCSTTSTVNVTSISVTAAFTANPTSGTAPLLVNFTNQTPGVGNVYSWNFADDNNNTSSATNPSHTYNTIGNYIVTLVVTDASGLCSATATISIDVFENASIVVPNVFTPNGDGKNDIFKITTTGMKDLNCDIFNRWGTKVFTINGVNGFWDGINSNDGTYFFILTATGFDGAEYKQQGYINLFK
jgi:gliding motility-associated-like protein